MKSKAWRQNQQRVQHRLAQANTKALKTVAIPPELALLAERRSQHTSREAWARKHPRRARPPGAGTHKHAPPLTGALALNEWRRHTAHHARVGMHLLRVLVQRRLQHRLQTPSANKEKSWSALRAASSAYRNWFEAHSSAGIAAVSPTILVDQQMRHSSSAPTSAAAGEMKGSRVAAGIWDAAPGREPLDNLNPVPSNDLPSLSGVSRAHLVARSIVFGPSATSRVAAPTGGVLMATWEVSALVTMLLQCASDDRRRHRSRSRAASGTQQRKMAGLTTVDGWPAFQELVAEAERAAGEGSCPDWFRRPVNSLPVLHTLYEHACDEMHSEVARITGPRLAMLLPLHLSSDVAIARALADGFGLSEQAPLAVARGIRLLIERRVTATNEGEAMLRHMTRAAKDKTDSGGGTFEWSDIAFWAPQQVADFVRRLGGSTTSAEKVVELRVTGEKLLSMQEDVMYATIDDGENMTLNNSAEVGLGIRESLTRQRIAYYAAVIRHMALESAYTVAVKLEKSAARLERRAISRQTRPHRPSSKCKKPKRDLSTRIGRVVRPQQDNLLTEDETPHSESEADVQHFIEACAKETGVGLKKSAPMGISTETDVGTGTAPTAVGDSRDENTKCDDEVVLDDVDDATALQMFDRAVSGSGDNVTKKVEAPWFVKPLNIGDKSLSKAGLIGEDCDPDRVACDCNEAPWTDEALLDRCSPPPAEPWVTGEQADINSGEFATNLHLPTSPSKKRFLEQVPDHLQHWLTSSPSSNTRTSQRVLPDATGSDDERAGTQRWQQCAPNAADANHVEVQDNVDATQSCTTRVIYSEIQRHQRAKRPNLERKVRGVKQQEWNGLVRGRGIEKPGRHSTNTNLPPHVQPTSGAGRSTHGVGWWNNNVQAGLMPVSFMQAAWAGEELQLEIANNDDTTSGGMQKSVERNGGEKQDPPATHSPRTGIGGVDSSSTVPDHSSGRWPETPAAELGRNQAQMWAQARNRARREAEDALKHIFAKKRGVITVRQAKIDACQIARHAAKDAVMAAASAERAVGVCVEAERKASAHLARRQRHAQELERRRARIATSLQRKSEGAELRLQQQKVEAQTAREARRRLADVRRISAQATVLANVQQSAHPRRSDQVKTTKHRGKRGKRRRRRSQKRSNGTTDHDVFTEVETAQRQGEESGPDSELRPESQPEPNSQQNFQQELQQGLLPESEPGPQLELQSEPQPEPQLEQQPEPQQESQPGLQLEPQLEPQPEPQLEPDPQSGLQQQRKSEQQVGCVAGESKGRTVAESDGGTMVMGDEFKLDCLLQEAENAVCAMELAGQKHRITAENITGTAATSAIAAAQRMAEMVQTIRTAASALVPHVSANRCHSIGDNAELQDAIALLTEAVTSAESTMSLIEQKHGNVDTYSQTKNHDLSDNTGGGELDDKCDGASVGKDNCEVKDVVENGNSEDCQETSSTNFDSDCGESDCSITRDNSSHDGSESNCDTAEEGVSDKNDEVSADRGVARCARARLPVMRVPMHLPRATPRPPVIPPPAHGKAGRQVLDVGTVPKRVHRQIKKTKKVKKAKKAKQPRLTCATAEDNDLREEVKSLQERLLHLERAAAGRAEMVARLTGRARLIPARRKIEEKLNAQQRKAGAQARAPRSRQRRAKYSTKR